jgi:hypothetical protein
MKNEQTRRLTITEVAEAMREANARGLPDGWSVEWDNKRKKRIWVSPDKSRKCYSLPQALAFSVKMGLVARDTLPFSQGTRKLSPDEIEAKLKEAKDRGLPDGWTIVWDNMANQRVWLSPDGSKKCKGIPQALVASVKMGLLTADMVPSSQTNRVLTKEEIKEALKEAKAGGLPKGWTVEWNPSKRKRRWVSPDGTRKCNSIPEALRISVKKGFLTALPHPTSKKRKHIPSGDRKLTEAEVNASLEEAETRGLSEGWTAEWSNELHRRMWISPEGRKYESISDALAKNLSSSVTKKRKKDRNMSAASELNVSNVVCI